MYRLAYVSTAHPSVATSDLQDILEAAIRNNAKANVTGTLLYNGANFLQVLEGEQKDVEKIYDRICVDARHGHVVTIFRESKATRSFSDSPMALQALKSEVGTLPDGMKATDDIELYLPSNLPMHLRQTLRSFNTRKG